ncbi:MAG: class I adenylate-forming enzyme family protein [Pseudohongiella sp.]|nr:class I adenylate-forming enzyme family protein [Pseudohongiella sp.]MDP2125945.1 class I adenylate-forming enzyme family protein [Pseudohongiella sp.]
MQSNDEQLLGQSPQSLVASLPARVSTPLFQRALAAPDSPALRDQAGHTLTYAELAAAVRAAQQQLVNLGITTGDRVLLVNENCLPLLVLILALSELGAWPVVVNARMAAGEIERIRIHSQPRLVLYLLDSAAAASHFIAAAADQTLVCRELELAGGQVGICVFEVGEDNDEGKLSEQGVFTLIYTTGTTGDPKGVMLTHRNMLYVAAVSGALRGLKAEDKIYLVLPVSHVFGISAVFLAAIYAGAELIIADRFDPALSFSGFEHQGISGIFGVPAMFAKLVDFAREQGISKADHKRLWPRLRFMYSGGAPLDPAIKEKTEKLFGLPLLNGYGMTESGPTICQVRFNEPLDNCSVGRPLPGMEVRLIGTDGRKVMPGEVGELHVRGPNIMAGYYRNPSATAAAINAEGFLNTGDMVRLDEQGNVHIAGRSKELIIHSGFNVYPPEVEGVISKHPEVLLCAVVGETVDGNENVIAYVQRTSGSELSATALQAYIKPLLTAYKRPSRIEFMEPLPTAPSGKVLKHKLRYTDKAH